MAMDIDKDSYRIPTAETCDGNSTNTTVLDDTAYPLVRNNRMFDIPEIIRSIAEFLDKPSLAASCRVSRLWATHCKPLLWRHVVDKHWRYSKFYASIRTQAHFIRTIKCEDKTDYQELLLCDLPRLKSISFHGSREVMQIRDKLLDRVSKTLTSLVMSSVADRLPEETVIAVRNLRHLTTLKLMNVDLNRNQLGEILRDCRCLDFLSLSRVKLLATSDSNLVTFEDEDASLIIAGNVSNDTNLYDSDDEGLILSSLQAEQTTAVTRVRYLALKEITVPLKYLIRLIRSCPELLELSLARNESMPLTADLTQTLKISCPRLYALDVGSCKQIDRETFISLFTSLTQLRVINLSGTRVADDELFVLAENCKNITRLDIQYCTSITSSGLHRFLSHCGTSLRHLEASGVTIDPTSFDRQYHWTCTKLQTLFVHVGLVGSTIPNKVPLSAISDSQNTSSAAIASTIEPAIPGIGSDSLSSPSTTPTEDVIGADKKRPQDAVSLPSRYLEDSSGSGSRDSFSTLNNNSAAITSPLSTNINADSDGDVVMDHPLHPIQDVCNVQYLGLMGCGPKLTCQTTSQNQLIRGFRSVKRLHVLGLYQSFKKEDLEWLVENLPELCRIDAEKYNVSDELLKWFEEVYPHVQICRHD
ncbi:hypothetical protein BCR41DRAFT_347885 [Lobosporangium transversale]|uniref:F-box domain-containing protein n=1 Tax=Lobosporangium transversale TaxID=64571 RepID=A0A1Y2GWV0_9FUNG|nr:hypothetical protein BCR41DRAFT_347885 [Lobosporangium transversale]ORZ26766.1 hypothetical protein BCR41DRAFT_347885 [Lobosporangium transversale]|eukprot:XP_021884529.1 hypothetical protein BCR41DRAFT_347885 [Lobosporangium transversale]